ncbi:MAG: hypothetical protein A2W04_04605 [Betaproteobacteria bacterium RBG_16_64_9]|nr:MAG: hypothetical protein A2W04_04605 [Betaproteobacteria bacterium RBG_16_64_9]
MKTRNCISSLVYSTEFFDTVPKSPECSAVCQNPPETHGSRASPALASLRNRSGLDSICESSARKYSQRSNGSPIEST